VGPEPLDVVIAIIPLTVLVGLLVLAALWLLRASRLRELREKQVLAMIERGLTPPSELVPPPDPKRARPAGEERFKSGGIMLVGLGVALALVIGVAGGHSRVGLGVGAAVAAIGVAMIVSALVTRDAGELQPPGEKPGGALASGPAPTPGDGRGA
jgi:hypothetical protein